MDNKPGKRNKLKVGDKVEVKRKKFNRMVDQIGSAYIKPATSCFDHKIDPEYYVEIQYLLLCKLGKMPLLGRVVGFGGSAYSPNSNRPLKDQKCVAVEFESTFGTWYTYLEERDLKKVKR